MKTPMQEHIEYMQEKLRILVEYNDFDAAAEVDECIQHAESMLEKEKMVICVFAKLFDDVLSNNIVRTREELFNEIFNSKEK